MALCMVLKRMKAIFIKDLIYLQANDPINTWHHELINLLYGQDLMFDNASRKQNNLQYYNVWSTFIFNVVLVE